MVKKAQYVIELEEKVAELEKKLDGLSTASPVTNSDESNSFSKVTYYDLGFQGKLNWEEEIIPEEHLAIDKKQAAKHKLIDSEHDYISRDRELKILEEIPKSDFKCKLLLLKFFKDITQKQGYRSIRYIPLGPANLNFVSLSCEIEWADGTITSGVADAHDGNCFDFTKFYLGPMAENRSFIRAVKAYFCINILGKDEIGPDTKDTNTTTNASITPQGSLQKLVENRLKVNSFNGFKNYIKSCIKEGDDTWIDKSEYDDWKEYNSYEDLPPQKAVMLIGKVKSVT